MSKHYERIEAALAAQVCSEGAHIGKCDRCKQGSPEFQAMYADAAKPDLTLDAPVPTSKNVQTFDTDPATPKPADSPEPVKVELTAPEQGPQPEQAPEPRGRVSAVPRQPYGAQQPHPLAVHPSAVEALQLAMDTHTPGRFVVNDDKALQTFAALTTGTRGAPRAWGSNVLPAPRLLHVVAGVPQQPMDAAFAQVSTLTLPTAQAAAAEGASLTEYATSAAGAVTAGRFGRWTDLTAESRLGTTAESILAMHRIGIALDLDQALINALETAAGAPVAFNADVPGQIRKAISQVLAATATEDPAALAILVNPADAHLLQDVTPIGGDTIGERFQRFSGAIVYPSTAADAGFMTVANVKAGARYFQGQGLTTVNFIDPKTGVETVATFTIAGYGVTLAGGFAVKQDVVSP